MFYGSSILFMFWMLQQESRSEASFNEFKFKVIVHYFYVIVHYFWIDVN